MKTVTPKLISTPNYFSSFRSSKPASNKPSTHPFKLIGLGSLTTEIYTLHFFPSNYMLSGFTHPTSSCQHEWVSEV